MLWVILIVLLAVIAFLIYVAMKPDSFRLERSILVDASAERIFPLIEDFHNWTQWSPFEQLDPALRRSYSGPAHGAGSVYAYAGNSRVGAGRMEIRESEPPGRMLAALDFHKPMVAHNFAEFTLRPAGGGTLVTWSMYGPSGFAAKLFTTFMNMEKVVGGQFEEGLENLKRVAEGHPA